MRDLETERLRLCAYQAGDLDRMAPLYADAGVTALTKLGRCDRQRTRTELEGYVRA
jgi:hypothetical protein